MRMWMVSVVVLCDKHLSGEHNEIHKHRHIFEKGWKITKRVQPGNVQIEPLSMKKRHDELAAEMIRRRWNHKSPYEQPDLSVYPEYERNAKVNIEQSSKELRKRCRFCRARMEYIISLYKREQMEDLRAALVAAEKLKEEERILKKTW